MVRRVLCAWTLVVAWSAGSAAGPLSEAERQETLVFIANHRKPTGGYGADPKPDSPASLSTTLAAVRAVKYLGAELADKESCQRFVASCYDAETGGFAPAPGGKPDPRSTCVGIMAGVDLQIPIEQWPEAFAYLEKASRQGPAFEDVRLAAAALESLQTAYPDRFRPPANWLPIVRAGQNIDGTFGEGDGRPRDTGGAVAALLRLKAPILDRDQVVYILRSGQREDGGWGRAGMPSELDTGYRVARALRMLGVRPDVEKLRNFIRSCRQPGGGYAVQPGQPPTVGATYYALVTLHCFEDAP